MKGRPRKAKADAKSYMLRIRMTEDDRRLLEEAARLLSLDTSAWARTELVGLARRILRSHKSDAG